MPWSLYMYTYTRILTCERMNIKETGSDKSVIELPTWLEITGLTASYCISLKYKYVIWSDMYVYMIIIKYSSYTYWSFCGRISCMFLNSILLTGTVLATNTRVFISFTIRDCAKLRMYEMSVSCLYCMYVHVHDMCIQTGYTTTYMPMSQAYLSQD